MNTHCNTTAAQIQAQDLSLEFEDTLEFEPLGTRQVVARLDGGTITSDAGGLLLREVDGALQPPARPGRRAGRQEHAEPAALALRLGRRWWSACGGCCSAWPRAGRWRECLRGRFSGAFLDQARKDYEKLNSMGLIGSGAGLPKCFLRPGSTCRNNPCAHRSSARATPVLPSR